MTAHDFGCGCSTCGRDTLKADGPEALPAVVRDVLSDRGGSERLVHPLLQTARGYLTDEDYFAVEATLQSAVERAKDLEAENERLLEADRWLRAGIAVMCHRASKGEPVREYADLLLAGATRRTAPPIDDINLAPKET